MGLSLQPTSRSRAAVARRAHNPKVGSSILPFATSGCFFLKQPFLFYLSRRTHIRQQTDGSSILPFATTKKDQLRSFFFLELADNSREKKSPNETTNTVSFTRAF